MHLNSKLWYSLGSAGCIETSAKSPTYPYWSASHLVLLSFPPAYFPTFELYFPIPILVKVQFYRGCIMFENALTMFSVILDRFPSFQLYFLDFWWRLEMLKQAAWKEETYWLIRFLILLFNLIMQIQSPNIIYTDKIFSIVFTNYTCISYWVAWLLPKLNG